MIVAQVPPAVFRPKKLVTVPVIRFEGKFKLAVSVSSWGDLQLVKKLL